MTHQANISILKGQQLVDECLNANITKLLERLILLKSRHVVKMQLSLYSAEKSRTLTIASSFSETHPPVQ